jgi:hypothetical protein
MAGRGRPRKIVADQAPPLTFEDENMDQEPDKEPVKKTYSAKDKVKVVNITNKPIQLSYGVILGNSAGYASFADACTFIDHIKLAE